MFLNYGRKHSKYWKTNNICTGIDVYALFYEENYDRIDLRVQKGTRDAYRANAEGKGMNLTTWIRGLMDAEMQKKTPRG